MGKSSDWAHRTSTPLYILSNSTKTRSLDCSSSPRIQSLLELFFLFFSPFFFLDFIALVWIFFSGLVFNSLKTGVCALNTKSNTVISSSEVWTHRRDFGTKLTSCYYYLIFKKCWKYWREFLGTTCLKFTTAIMVYNLTLSMISFWKIKIISSSNIIPCFFQSFSRKNL